MSGHEPGGGGIFQWSVDAGGSGGEDDVDGAGEGLDLMTIGSEEGRGGLHQSDTEMTAAERGTDFERFDSNDIWLT